ncbi:mannose-6-phosphate isomerase, class I, partial [uncultured Clostridium sp.]|uniref:mannose-6-phosphate isomerase, class I n=1 Tax=uncultured Clostridium sp. TaxID=59620 RepID=UPI0025D66B5F
NLPEGDIGESWDVACHENGTSIVANGRFKGISFDKLIESYGEKVLGRKYVNKKFPLLVKLINSNDNLSVQVHPNDEYAKIKENSFGKTEAWYVIDAEEGAELIVGTNGCTKEQFQDAIKNNTVENCLNRIKVKKGDGFLINSGLVHAIGKGLIIAEIQQNSDITYRVYDYGRPREIHVEKSLEVIDFSLKPERLVEDYKEYDGYKFTSLCKNKYFSIDKCVVDTNYISSTNGDNFVILTIVDGSGKVTGNHYTEDFKKGDSILLPASLGEYTIEGKLEVLITNPL